MTSSETTFNDEELIARLRNTPNWMREGFQNWKDNVRTYDTAPFEAAARIEQLVATNEALTKERDQWVSHAKAAIWSDSEELKETERRLAKAVEALDMLVRDCEADYPPSHGAIKHFAIATLAEISSHNKGESHD